MSVKLHLICMKTEAKFRCNLISVKRRIISFNSYNYIFFSYSFSLLVFLIMFSA